MGIIRIAITDRALALVTLETPGLDHREDGTLLRFGTAESESVLDLETGLVRCADSDEALVGRLRQHYAEAHIRAICTDQGITVEAREVEPNGDVVLKCSRRLTQG